MKRIVIVKARAENSDNSNSLIRQIKSSFQPITRDARCHNPACVHICVSAFSSVFVNPVNSLLHRLVVGRALHAQDTVMRHVVWRHDALGDGEEPVRSYMLEEDLVRSTVDITGAVAPDENRKFARVSDRDVARKVDGVIWEAGIDVDQDVAAVVILLLQTLAC